VCAPVRLIPVHKLIAGHSRAVAATLLPADILSRPKQGFGVPLGTWFRGDLRELFGDTLLATASLQRGYFRPDFVRRLVDEHLSAKRDHTLRLWQLVVFEKWHQHYASSFPLSALSLPSDSDVLAR